MEIMYTIIVKVLIGWHVQINIRIRKMRDICDG